MPERRYHSPTTAPPSLDLLSQQGVTDLLAQCDSCFNLGVIPVEVLIQRLGSNRLITEVKGRCSVCGSRDADIRPDYSPGNPGVIAHHT